MAVVLPRTLTAFWPSVFVLRFLFFLVVLHLEHRAFRMLTDACVAHCPLSALRFHLSFLLLFLLVYIWSNHAGLKAGRHKCCALPALLFFLSFFHFFFFFIWIFVLPETGLHPFIISYHFCSFSFVVAFCCLSSSFIVSFYFLPSSFIAFFFFLSAFLPFNFTWLPFAS